MNKTEDVARAIFEKIWPMQEWDGREDVCRAASAVAAIAAIKAMREPDVQMIAAFWRQKNTGTQEIGETGDDRSDYAAWRAAIDAALQDGGEK